LENGGCFDNDRSQEKRPNSDEFGLVVKSRDSGDIQLSFLSPNTLEWRPDDEFRATAVDPLAAEAASSGERRWERGMDLPTLWDFPKDLLQMATA
jgi:hypothetical protein